MRRIFMLFAFLGSICVLNAQTVIEWEHSYGGAEYDYLYSLQETSDNGFILGGTNYYFVDETVNNGLKDYWVIKTDFLGEIEWQYSYGGSNSEVLQKIIETTDGGYLLGGYSSSNDGDVGGNNGKQDLWIVKIDALGNIEWEQNYGYEERESLSSLLQTTDGGFILGASIPEETLYYDFWVLKIDALGNIEWEETYGGSKNDLLYSIIQTDDNGFILGGSTNSTDGDISIDENTNVNSWQEDIWVVKIDALGNIEWEKTYGHENYDELYGKIISTSDGGFLMGGSRYYFYEDFSDLFYAFNYWVAKIDNVGNIEWEKNYEDVGEHNNFLQSIQESVDGGFILGGIDENNDFMVNLETEEAQYSVIKIDSNGEIEWKQNYGGSGADYLYDLVETTDGGLLLGGHTYSNDGDIGENSGELDIWIVKIKESNKIRTHAFYDTNENNVWDNDEQAFFSQDFTFSPNPLYTIVKPDYETVFFVEPEMYTIAHDNPLWTLTNNVEPSYLIDIADSIDIDTTLLFPMRPVYDFFTQDIDMTLSPPRCNLDANIWLTYKNNSSEPTSGTIHFVMDELTTLISSVPPASLIQGDTLFWSYENLYPTHMGEIHIICKMPGVDAIGESINFSTSIEMSNEQYIDNDYFVSPLYCSCDPNDKLVTPIGIGEENYTLFEDSLFNYTIRFQNTGNDTAFNVTILDTLSEYLNIDTYNFIASSHEVNTKINPTTRIIEFEFNDIYLPDSNVNEVGSHGFVKFNIESNPNLAENTPIENTAGIYFDLNPPIITNTTQNLMVSMLPTAIEQTKSNNEISLYPNPNTGIFIAKTQNSLIKTITIYDRMGKVLQTKNINNNTTQIDLQGYTGVYFISIKTEEGVFVEKIVIQ